MLRKNIVRALSAFAMVFGLGTGTAWAQTDTDTVAINYEVTQILLVNISASNVTLTINTGTAGAGLTSVSSSGVTYAITSNAATSKLTGVLEKELPANISLQVNVTAPGTGTSAGAVTLSETAADLVTGMGVVDVASTGMTFTLNATVAAGVVGAATAQFTMTVIGS